MGTINPRPAARPRRLLPTLSLLPLILLALCALPLTARSASGGRVLVDGKTIPVADTVATVREALAEAHVRLDADDEVSPARDAAIPSDGIVRVSRVKFTEGTTDVRIPYQTVVRAATRGNRPYHPTVTSAGRTGLKRVTYRAKVVDGREVERTTLREEVVREAVPQVVTARKPAGLASRGAYAGKKTMKVLSTAYDPGPGSCGPYANGKTCNGKRAGYGIIAVDPSLIPLGTKIFVPEYGYGIAADVGGAIKGARIDLGFNSRPGAFKWGKKWVTITILD